MFLLYNMFKKKVMFMSAKTSAYVLTVYVDNFFT